MQSVSLITGGSTELWTDKNDHKVIERLEKQQAKRHYSNLYTCKNFRNRLMRLQAFIQEIQVDTLVLILGKFE
jgi:hypothetical protein